MVQSNSATSQESAAASEELSSQAVLLKETVNQFKLNKNSNTQSNYEIISPEVLQMLENMSLSGGSVLKHKMAKPEETAGLKSKIALNDNEFGKY